MKISNSSKNTLVKGIFEQGKKVGVWAFMGKGNSIYLKYDYEQREFIQNREETQKSDSIQVKLGNEFKLKSVDNPAIYLGYKNEIKRIINEEMRPTSIIFQEAKSGLVIISFDVNQIGEAVNFNIESAFNDKINKAVLNSFEKIKYGWVSAAINGAPVVSKMYMMLNFNFF